MRTSKWLDTESAWLIEGLMFGKTELLRAAFEEAKPKSTASLKNAIQIDLPETPTHVRFTCDEQSIIVALPSKGVLVFDCGKLQQQVSCFGKLSYLRNLWLNLPKLPSRALLFLT